MQKTYRNGSATTRVRKTSRYATALASLGLLILYGACREGGGGYSGGGGGAGDCLEADCQTSTCGNDVVEGNELCDKANLNKETCKTLGDGLYSGGTLRCTSKCTFDVSMCFGPTEICNDNVDNDADGKADCDDPDCSGDANCSENGAGGQPASGGATQGTGGAGPSEAGGAGGDGGASQGMAGSGGAGGAGGESSGSTDKLIYLIDMPKKSNFGGITGADELCAQKKPPSGNAKALIVNGTTRYACTTANCDGGDGEHLDWVLSPDTAYKREDGTRIGVTNSAGVFVFPLDAAIAPGYTYWTGLTGNWTSNDDDCADWSQTTGYFAYLGNGDVTTSDAIAGVTESCAYLAGAFIACVEQ